MTRERASLGFGDELEEFNPAEWNPPREKVSNDRPRKEQIDQAAKASGFSSREPKPAPLPVPAGAGQGAPRRRRTGRNAQFNLKARPETIAAFIAIADSRDWGLGETLEHAVALLEREYGRSS